MKWVAAGEVLWCLRRLEPDGVRELPSFLHYEKIDYDRSVLDESMLKLETQLDDELSEENVPGHKDIRGSYYQFDLSASARWYFAAFDANAFVVSNCL